MNDKVKSLFFSQYYGQNVAWCKNSADEYQLFRVLSNTLVDEVDYLLLRDISQLEDSEVLNLAYLAMYHPTIEDYQKYDVWIGEGDNYPDGSLKIEIGCRCWEGKLVIEADSHIWMENEDDSEYKEFVYNALGCYDYLRSIGILLPFCYLGEDNTPVTLSVDEIIKSGWAKIKE